MAIRDRRHGVRHPIPVPVVVRPRGETGSGIFSTVADLGEGGIAFASPRRIPVDSVVDVLLALHDRTFSLAGSVLSCSAAGSGGTFRVGLAFLHPSMSFRMKLAEQVLRIQEFRLELSQERGEEVTTDEAAREWIARHAAEFADLYPR